MKQLLQNLKTGQALIAEVPIPTPRAGTALIKTAASLVSAGTERMVVEFAEKSLVGKARSRPDLVKQVIDKARREGLLNTAQAAFNKLDEPMALGYSSAGTIIELGENMDGFHVGQRVACAGGGYASHAEYVTVPRNLLAPIPDNLDFESAAFATLGAIVLHGFRLAEPKLGETVAVIGIGLLGLMTMQIAAAAGCHVIGIDIDPARVELAESLAFSACSRPQAVDATQAFTANRGADAVIICADAASNDPVQLAGQIARDRAKIVATGAVGLEIPRKIYFAKELSFINSRSYGPGRYDASYEEGGADYPIGYVRWTEGRNLEAVVDLLASGKLDVKNLITHRLPIENATEAYEIITGKQEEPFIGVLLTYPEAGNQKSGTRIDFPTITRHLSLVELGMIGAGLFANATLLPALKKTDIELVGIASAGGLKAQHSAKKFGFSYATSSADEIINDDNVNTVAILTRHDQHADLVVQGLKAGKNVFVEKPLAVNSEQLSVISEQLRNTQNAILTVGFNRRFAPLAQELSAFYADRVEPLYVHYRINAGYLPLNHWIHDPEQGGGRIIGEGCHFIDFVTFLVGESPISVSTHALPDNGKYREDNVSMTFTFPDGSIAVVDYLANGDKSVPKERVEVFGGGKVATLNDYRSLEMIHDGKRKMIKNRLGQDKGWKDEMGALIEAVKTGKPPIPYDQLIGVTKASFSAIESLRSNVKKVAIK
ncbi:MAG: Gfo/Idh/MocA family oxidoreductase [Anaerolineae bacterium]|jgi:predicted dehydrogenase|nr:Gfo/Idh/MocA family oxidoreductase [Anaerolineae bacterium]MBT4309799.1 Gfo/Idh/MocA family oxidoreductase [Anaerolineae bacterium]MBT4457068.1 Gfo/Idh/MocA family oxidoreductase [Anaerolineae bacterium]MBT4843448.1 Gfo/Idh/MocA family oxidoreductase [Anaerolineae bacterium]MBT6063148.1 Gfo/Idh/MocA family oxidoreductase [Anaerolineae bacterium]